MFVIGAALPSLALSTEVSRRQQAEQRQGVLLAELDHRVKNMLANVSIIAQLSGRGARSVAAFTEALEDRIQAMAAAHALARNAGRQGAPLDELVRTVVGPCGGPASIEIAGKAVTLGRRATHALALALHELTTNAVKYGALSTPGGRVSVSWHQTGGRGNEPVVRLVWRESGGPAVEANPAKGFGLTFVQDLIGRELGAEVRCEFPATGFIFTIEGPFGTLADTSREAVSPAPAAAS
jgi:two-component sensor histidine kinase